MQALVVCCAVPQPHSAVRGGTSWTFYLHIACPMARLLLTGSRKHLDRDDTSAGMIHGIMLCKDPL